MANITSVTGRITILAKKKEDAIKFIDVIKKTPYFNGYIKYLALVRKNLF